MKVPPRRPDWWLGPLLWTVLPLLVKVVGKMAWRLRFEMPHGFPDPPFVVAANHHSFLDSLLVGTALGDRIRFVALADLFGNHRWLDAALVGFDVIPVARGTVPLGTVRQALDHLEAGGVVGLFPEGIRHDEFHPSRAKPGAAWLASRMGVPLVPVAIAGSERVLGVDNRLRRGRIAVSVGRPLHPTGTSRADVRELSRRWGDWVAETLAASSVNMADDREGDGPRW